MPVEVGHTQCEWVQAHEMLSRLARTRAAADAEEGRWLLAALRSAAHVHLGFGSFGEYVGRLFGYTARTTQEKLRVAEALEDLPATARALEGGTLNWSAVRELSRVAVGNTEHEWLEVARGKTVHQLEALVAGKLPGDRPASPAKLAATRHVLRFEVSPETLCLFRETMQQLRRNSATPLDDDAALLLMARQVLAGPCDEGRAGYQIALSLCPVCGAGRQLASGELVSVGADVVAMADCDGQYLGFTSAPAPNQSILPGENAHTGGPRVADHDARNGAHAGASRLPSGSPIVACAASRPRDERGAGATDTGACSSTVRELRRATQTIPPATRRAVLRRDQQRCTVPGCRNSRFLDVHHIQPRLEGGGNHADNLIVLCGAHHRAGHRGELEITGSVATGVRFQHADGNGYGHSVEARAVQIQVKVFATLRRLGFREAETRQALAQLGTMRKPGDATFECVLREALAKLTTPAH